MSSVRAYAPWPGTINAKVYECVAMHIDGITVRSIASCTGFSIHRVHNAISSLRSNKRIVGDGQPGSKFAKRWRIASPDIASQTVK